VALSIYDVNGKRVREIAPVSTGGNEQSAEWDGTDSQGHRLASGVYFLQARTPSARETQKVLLLR
jgi:flagellar hook assembly protein FlgD